MEGNSAIAIAGLIQTAVGGMMGYVAWVLSSMRAETREKLNSIQTELKTLNGRVGETEDTDIRIDEWRKEYTKMSDRCRTRFESLDQDIRQLRDRSGWKPKS